MQENLRYFVVWPIAFENNDNAGLEDLILTGTEFSDNKTIAASDDIDLSAGLFRVGSKITQMFPICEKETCRPKRKYDA